MMFRICMFLYFLSGAVALIYETVWVRLFVVAFGSTAVAVGGVLAAYMSGLALGSWWGGVWADRSRASMVRSFAVLELLLMISALLVPWAIRVLDPGIGSYFQSGRFILSLVAIAIPTALMGATYPVMARAVSGAEESFGSLAGRLYAVNLLGAALGCFMAGFILLPGVGTHNTNLLGVLLNLLVVGVAFSVCRKLPQNTQTAASPGKGRGGLLIVALGTGFSGITYQVVYTRVLALIVHNTVYAFASILTVFLLGIFLGSRLASHLADDKMKRWRLLGAAQIALGVYGIMSIPLASSLADRFLQLNYGSRIFGDSFNAFLAGQFVLSAALVLIPSFLLGFAFPLMVAIYHGRSNSYGRSAGVVYATNTLGSVLGAAGCGFYFIPYMGTKGALLLACGVNLLLGISLVSTDRETETRSRIGVAVLVVFFVFFLSPLTRYDLTFTHLASGPGSEVVFREEDASALIEVFRQNGVLSLISNRQQQEGSTSALSLYSQKKQGYLPLLLHPSPEKVLGIGLGSGISYRPWSFMALQVARIAEISPAIIRAADAFASYNGNIAHRSDVKVIHADGRGVLKTGDGEYDLIVADLFSPYREGTGNLYTVEHYRRCRNRLGPGGMMWQWLPPHQLPYPALVSVIKSFVAVFPHSTLWMTRQSIALQGGLKPLSISWPQLLRKFNTPAIKADLAADGLDDPQEFLSLFFAGEKVLQALPPILAENTEDNGVVEFFTSRYLHLLVDEKLYFSNLERLLPLKESVLPYLAGWNGSGLEKREAAKTHVYRGRILKANGDTAGAGREFARALELNPKEMNARR